MSALQVKRLGVGKTLVLIRRPDFVHLTEDLGIDHAVSPRAIMAREVLTLLQKGKGRSLADMGAGEAEILELHLTNATLSGRRLKDIPLSQKTLILLIKRAEQIIVPSGSTELKLDDVLLIIGKSRERKRLIGRFAG